jgi:nucleotide-binding universal stress UspA family protein
MFAKILVPLDGSKMAGKILPQVIELAKTLNSQVTLIYVYYAEVSEATSGVIKEAFAREAKQCELFLAQAAKELENQGIKVNFACIEGDPARGIIGYAEKNGMDLIAMATHGRGEVAWMLGSVAEKVVSHSPIPVLLMRVVEIKPVKTKEDYFLDLLDRGIP